MSQLPREKRQEIILTRALSTYNQMISNNSNPWITECSPPNSDSTVLTNKIKVMILYKSQEKRLIINPSLL